MFQQRKTGKRNGRSGMGHERFRDGALLKKNSPQPAGIVSLIAGQLKSGTGLALIATLVVASTWLFVSFMIGIFWPRPMVVVQPFEVSDAAAKELHLSGKNAANFFVDRVNALAIEGAAFRGNGYSSSRDLPQMKNMLKIPVESSFNLTIGGISADAVVSVFRRARYQEVPINGDVILSSKGIAIHVRWNRLGEADSLSSQVDPSRGLEACIDALAEQFLEHLNPELAGRAFLRERNYDAAIDAFRQWAISEPGSSEAYEFMARGLAGKGGLETDKELQGQEATEAIAVGQWADLEWKKKKVVWLAPNPSSESCNINKNLESQSFTERFEMGWYRLRANLLAGVTPGETGNDRAAGIIGAEQLGEPLREDLAESEALLGGLAKKFPLNTDYLVNLGVTQEQRLDFAGALTSYKLAEAIDPRNAGIQRNIGVEYLNNAWLPEMKGTQEQFRCYALQRDNVALHRSLGMVAALSDAVSALHALNDDESALRLADLIHIIRPDNKTVMQEYALTLATAGEYPEAVDAFWAFSKGQKEDAHSRDLALVKLIASVQGNRGVAPALGLAEKAKERWKDSIPLQLAATLEKGMDLLSKKKYPEAQNLFGHACQLGNGDACGELGLIYLNHEGVDENDPKAAAYFKKSCDQGSAAACSNLGLMYAKGTGVDHQDYREALILDKKACAEDIGAACNNLGLLYENASGVKQSIPQAAILYAKGCFHYSAKGCSNLGDDYLNGTGVPKDLNMAKVLLTQGCEMAHESGCDSLKADH